MRLIILLAAALIAAPAGVSAQEPLRAGQTVEGRLLAGAENAAAFLIEVRERDILTFNLVSTLPNSQLELYDPLGLLVNIGYGESAAEASLVFVAYADGIYMLKVVNYGEGEGRFSLTAAQADVQTLTPNQGVAVELRSEPVYFIFEARRDQLFNLSVDSGGQVSARFDVLDPNGYQIAYGASALGGDPMLPRLLAREDGAHTMLLYPPADAPGGPVIVTLREIEPLSLDAGPQTITLDSSVRTEVLRATLTQGTRYRISLTVLSGDGADLTLFLLQGEQLLARLNATAEAMQTVSLEFIPRSLGGPALMTIQDTGASDETRLTIAIEALPGG